MSIARRWIIPCVSVVGFVLLAAVLYLPVRAQAPAKAVMPIGKPITIKAPLGLPPVPVPADNPLTEESIALGRRLYYDPQLSLDSTISCASCHGPQTGFSDARSVSVGVGGKTGTRHSPTVINSAYSGLQFWDGRAASLEEQAVGPIANPVEMAHSLDGVVKRVQADATYREPFKKAWGTDQITIDMVAKSIASFERTVIAGDSPFDRFYYGHDKNALSPAAQRGLKIFTDPKKANCQVCHTIGQTYALFTDNKFHNLGVGADLNGKLTDVGRYAVTKNDADMGAFQDAVSSQPCSSRTLHARWHLPQLERNSQPLHRWREHERSPRQGNACAGFPDVRRTRRSPCIPGFVERQAAGQHRPTRRPCAACAGQQDIRKLRLAQAVLKPVGAKVGAPWLNWHTLRRTHCTLFQEAGGSLRDAQAQLGHSKMSTTLEIYTIPVDARRREVVEKLDQMVTNGDELAESLKGLKMPTQQIQ